MQRVLQRPAACPHNTYMPRHPHVIIDPCCSCSESYSNLPPAEALEAEGGAEVELATDEWLVSSFFYQVGSGIRIEGLGGRVGVIGLHGFHRVTWSWLQAGDIGRPVREEERRGRRVSEQPGEMHSTPTFSYSSRPYTCLPSCLPCAHAAAMPRGPPPMGRSRWTTASSACPCPTTTGRSQRSRPSVRT